MRAADRSKQQVAATCLVGALDGDGDGLCDEAEAMYGTDPRNPDTDDDALSDGDELFGMSFDWEADDSAPNVLDLRSLGANPLHRDVLVEIDYFSGRRPDPSTLNLVVDAFAAAPTSNPDGTPGIRLHYLIDSEVVLAADDPAWELGSKETPIDCPEDKPECDGIAWDSFDIYAEFDPIKSKHAHPTRHAAFHYALFGKRMRGGSSGISFDINGHDLIVTTEDRTDPMWIAGTFMHELGHNLGLKHGGNEALQNKPNYFSVMSYIYQAGVCRDGGRVLDYSRHPVAALAEAPIDEHAGLEPGPGTTEKQLASYCVLDPKQAMIGAHANVDVDWNGNRRIDPGSYALDFSGNRSTGDVIAASQNDWENLKFDARGSIGSRASWDSYTMSSYEPTEAPCLSASSWAAGG